MKSRQNGPGTRGPFPSRREFLAGALALALSEQNGSAWGAEAGKAAGSELPARPKHQPLDFHALADSFDNYIMDPSHGVVHRAPDGRRFFASALESSEDGGLTCYGPVAIGHELRGHGLDDLGVSLAGYYSESYGLFLDSHGATLCEYWYLMNVTALAFGLVRLRFAHEREWIARVESSARRLRELAQQIHYDFNDQGYDFARHAPFTRQDIYRQPDAIGGYSYVMLLAWKLTGQEYCLAEARTGIDRYLAFRDNPWYEVPSGAMAVLAASYLSILGHTVDVEKALRFVLDAKVGLMATGAWGGYPVDGLMAGFRTEPPGEVYSMESMVTLPYLMPALRYHPGLASEVARYALNATANLRWFYPEYLPRENQSRPDLPPMVPYERVSREAKGKSPYAEGDYAGHRSVYGGAYVMWLDRMTEAQGDGWLLRWDLERTNFLENGLAPAYLYYNPGPDMKTVALQVAGRVHDLAHRRILPSRKGKTELTLAPGEARVVEIDA